MQASGEFPCGWKDTFVHFIPKSEGNSLRPISLTSCLCKLFETMVKNRLDWWVEHHNLLPKSQHGFRKGKSCTDNIVNLTLKVDEAFMEKKDVLAAFLDIEGAFNNVNIDILLERLSEVGCSTALLKFIKFITQERYVYSDYLGNEYRRVYKGVPQGGVLSPILFSIYTSNVAAKLPKTISVSQFADDFALYIKFKTMKRSKKTLEKAIQTVGQNLELIGLEFSPSKTKLVHFNNKQIKPGSTEILIKDCIIKSVESTRFLGIIFDYKLSFVPQINLVLKKSTRALNIIKFLCGKWWGSDPETLITLYKSYVRSLFEFGCFVYFPTRKTLAQKLERVQFAAIRIALGYRISTPTNILLGESKLLTIRERASYLGKCYFSKALSTKLSSVSENIDSYEKVKRKKQLKKNRLLNQCLEKVIEISKNIETKDKPTIYQCEYNISISPLPVNVRFEHELKESVNPNQILNDYFQPLQTRIIYTDGSKIKDAPFVGSACICPDLKLKFKKSIFNQASIFTAECIALENALKIIREHPYKDYSILTDSMSALLSLSSAKIEFKKKPSHTRNKKKSL